MPAHQNIIAVFPHDWTKVRKVLTLLQAPLDAWLGPLRVLSVLDCDSGSHRNPTLEGFRAADVLPDLSDHELIGLYPYDHPRRGCVIVYHEGACDAVILSLVTHAAAQDRLACIWPLVRREASAVLVGEELEAEAGPLDRLLQSGQLPAGYDLCCAAVVRDPIPTPGDERSEPWRGGRLLLRKR